MIVYILRAKAFHSFINNIFIINKSFEKRYREEKKRSNVNEIKKKFAQKTISISKIEKSFESNNISIFKNFKHFEISIRIAF